jgi:DNA-binding SARP family transcriptional activator/WD40 repeat protein
MGVLGTLTVVNRSAGPGDHVHVPGAKERALLGRLLVTPGRIVPVDTLAEDLWDGAPPATARKSLQAHVVRLRTALEPHRTRGSPGRYVVHQSDGYLLAVEATDVDASIAGVRAAEGHAALTAGDARTAHIRFTAALDLWRGEPFEDWRDMSWSAGERRRLAGVHDALVEGRLDADLALGRHTELVSELERLTTTEPLREGWWWRLMLALYRCDRQADALATARRVRALLVEELGVEPGSQLRELEQAILEHSAELRIPGGAARILSPRAPALPDDACPYRGLAAYDVGDAHLLHGRGSTTRAAIAKLRGTTIVAVSGPSGAGKSSLVRAGLLPAIAAGAVPGSETWRPLVMTPGAAPVDGLDALDASGGPPAVVVVDQFEELWTSGLDPGERLAFLAALLALPAGGAARVVLVVRGDHLGRLAESPELAAAVTSGLILVPPMTEAEVREVIELPATVAGLAVDPDLTEAVLREVAGQPGVLPLLSSALVGTWERRKDGRLTLAGYLEAGGVTGALAGVAESVLAELAGTGDDVVRRLFLRLATTGDAGSVVRRRVPSAELGLDRVDDGDGSMRQVLEAFVTARLVTVDAGHVEITHEAVFTAWPRLVDWLAHDAASRAVRAHLAPAAAAWAANGRPEDQLYRGARLEAAQEWAASADADPTPNEVAFVAASLARSQAELAKAQAQAQRERRGRRRTRRLAAVLAATAVAAIAAGVLAVARQRDADASALRADAERLAAAAAVAASNDVSMLLAAQAYRLASTDQTHDALFAAATANTAVLGVFGQPGLRRVAVGHSGGRTLVYGMDEHDVLVWDLDRPTAPRRLDGLGSPRVAPAAIDVSPATSGAYAGLVAIVGARAGEAPALHLLEPSGAARWSFTADRLRGRPAQARFTAAGDHVVVESVAGETTDEPRHHAVRVNVATGAVEPLPVDDRWPPGGGGVEYSSGISRDGRTVMSGGVETVIVHDVERRTILELDTRGRDVGDEWGVPLATGVVEMQAGGTLHWHPAGSRPSVQAFAVHNGDVVAAAGDMSGRLLVTAATDGRIVVTELVASQQDPPGPDLWKMRQSFTGHDGNVVDLAVTPDGSLAVTAGEDGRIVAWDLTGHSGFVTGVDPMEPIADQPRGLLTLADPVVAGRGDATVLVAATLRGTQGEDQLAAHVNATILHPRTRRVVASVPLPTYDRLGLPAAQAAVSPDGGTVAVAGLWTVGIVDVGERRLTGHVTFPATAPANPDRRLDTVTAVAWSPDGRRLLVGTGWNEDAPRLRGALVTVDPRTMRPSGTPLALGAGVATLTPLPRDGLLAAGLVDGSVVVVDPARRAVVRRLTSGGPVRAFAVSSDGAQLAAVGMGRTLDVWDTRTWQPTIPRQRFAAAGVGVQWLPGRNAVVIGGTAGRAEVFDVARRDFWGAGLPLFRDGAAGDVHVAPVTGPILDLFSGIRPGRAAKDGARFPLEPAAWLRHICGIVARDLTIAEWRRYLPDRDYRPTCSDVAPRAGPQSTR